MGWLINATPRLLYPRERPGTDCIGDWVGFIETGYIYAFGKREASEF
jgi:hypothetical protein